MKYQFLILLIIGALIFDEISAEKHKHKKLKHKKYHPHEKTLQEDEQKWHDADLIHLNEHALKEAELSEAEHYEQQINDNAFYQFDPCANVKCSAGQVCDINEDNKPHCVCVPVCPEEDDPRRKVCTNYNETMGSDCAVHQQRCYCNTGDERCVSDDYKHVHIVYYGECREMPECTADEMADFPRRMRDWLFNIMIDLAERKELNRHYLKMKREAETNHTRKWANAAIWKWCDLDRDGDKAVSRHELFPIRAPLLSLEHCIAPFLDNCDNDNNHRITLEEWGKCLQLEAGDLEERCKNFNNDPDEDDDE